MKKIVAGAAVAASIAGASVAIAVVNPLGLAGAGTISVQAGQQDPGTATTPTTAAPTDPATPGEKGPGHGGRGEILGGVLDELVADGTITQAQADAIRGKLKEKVESLPKGEGHGPGKGGFGGGPGGPGGPGGFGGLMGAGLDQLATSLGMTADEVKAGLREGKTIAQLAEAKGIAPQKVIDDIVAAATAKIDEAVASGKLPAERADTIKANLAERIASFVNEGGKAFGGRGHR